MFYHVAHDNLHHLVPLLCGRTSKYSDGFRTADGAIAQGSAHSYILEPKVNGVLYCAS